ncbi:MAG: hypothetical protein FJ147_13955 [Deltaproteobacteria bacterium]|nr:hypothetical protein [Deltaproteobacteria bacterium]
MMAMQDVRQARVIEALRRVAQSPRAAIEDDVASMRNLSPQEHGKRLVAVCRAAWAILRSRPDFPQIAAYRDPLPDDFAEKWQRLVTRRRIQQQKSHGPR